MTVAVAATPRRGLTQLQAADYLGVSSRWFRDNVHVEPKPVGMPEPGKKPVMRYMIDDLDGWVDKCDLAFLEQGRGK